VKGEIENIAGHVARLLKESYKKRERTDSASTVTRNHPDISLGQINKLSHFSPHVLNSHAKATSLNLISLFIFLLDRGNYFFKDRLSYERF
jgi:hypothetical protein